MRAALITATLSTALLGGCGFMGRHWEQHVGRHLSGPAAQATLEATRGNGVAGTVSFEQQGAHIFMHARVTGLKSNQDHGFHIHEKGDCSSGDGMGTGGHFNPGSKPHGPQDAEHHAGDLPALRADANGVAEMRVRLHGLSLGAGAADIIGKGLIVHAAPDDYKTQPTGNSGARIACGVIAVKR